MIVSFFLVVGFVALLVIWRLALHAGRQPTLRPIPGWSSLPSQVGQALESGRPLHLSMGMGAIGGGDTLSGLAAVPALDYLAGRMAGCDEAPVVTAGDPTMLPLALDGLRRARSPYRGPDARAIGQAWWFGSQPMSYAAGVTSLLHDGQFIGSGMLGAFGVETALCAEASQRTRCVQTGGAVDPGAQAVLSLTSDAALIGEDLFAGRAYLDGDRNAIAALLAQDTARLGLIAAMILGFALAVLGVWR